MEFQVRAQEFEEDVEDTTNDVVKSEMFVDLLMSVKMCCDAETQVYGKFTATGGIKYLEA